MNDATLIALARHGAAVRLVELQSEQEVLEAFLRGRAKSRRPRPPRPAARPNGAPKRTKPLWTEEKRKAVSARMKAYWVAKRAKQVQARRAKARARPAKPVVQ